MWSASYNFMIAHRFCQERVCCAAYDDDQPEVVGKTLQSSESLRMYKVLIDYAHHELYEPLKSLHSLNEGQDGQEGFG